MELAVSSCYLSDAVALFSPGFCSGFCHLAPHEHAVLRLIVIIFGSSSGTPQHLHSIRCECSAQSWKITARSKSGHNNPRTFLIMELYQGSTNRKHVGTPRRAWVSSLPTNHISPWQRRGVGLLLGIHSCPVQITVHPSVPVLFYVSDHLAPQSLWRVDRRTPWGLNDLNPRSEVSERIFLDSCTTGETTSFIGVIECHNYTWPVGNDGFLL